MAAFFEWLLSLVRQFRFLAIVLPWERAVRVRLGNRVAIWEPGWHIKLPFLDEVQLLNTRLRLVNPETQTLTTRDGHPLTVSVTVGFSIHDPEKAMLRMHYPEASVKALALSVVAEAVCATPRAELTPAALEGHVMGRLRTEPGYTFEFVRVTDFAYARTYRLLNSSPYRDNCTIEERKL